MVKIPDWNDNKNPFATLARDALDEVWHFIDEPGEIVKVSYIIGRLAYRFGLPIEIVNGKVVVTLTLSE